MNKNCEPASEEKIYPIFEKFGKIKNIATNCNQSSPVIYVEFYKNEDAKKAINELSNEDKKLLGDENCEINFYFVKKKENVDQGKNQVNNNSNQTNNNLYQNNNLPFNRMMVFPNNIGINYLNNTLYYQMIQQQNYLKNNINNSNQNNLNTEYNKSIKSIKSNKSNKSIK